ncbi:AAA family ATPase [Nocardia sp. NPDC057272]|uniref:AAA family ATPase n=1 Tax=Nocardia sp. NPDC057272 TaxID=3346079 RepID=UPI0036424EC8
MAARWGGRRAAQYTAAVLSEYGTLCVLQRPGCTTIATTADHIVPRSLGGDPWAIENGRPACRSCNSSRGNGLGGATPGVRVVVVMGPPASGKSTHVRAHASADDVVIDLDVIASALRGPTTDPMHVYPAHVRHVAIAARQAAIRRAVRLAEKVTVWLIHSMPSASQLASYRAEGYELVTVDPGAAVVVERAREQRPAEALTHVDRYYVGQADGGAVAPSREW